MATTNQQIKDLVEDPCKYKIAGYKTDLNEKSEES